MLAFNLEAVCRRATNTDVEWAAGLRYHVDPRDRFDPDTLPRRRCPKAVTFWGPIA